MSVRKLKMIKCDVRARPLMEITSGEEGHSEDIYFGPPRVPLSCP